MDKLTKKQKVEVIKATEVYADLLGEIDCDDQHKQISILDFMNKYIKSFIDDNQLSQQKSDTST